MFWVLHKWGFQEELKSKNGPRRGEKSRKRGCTHTFYWTKVKPMASAPTPLTDTKMCWWVGTPGDFQYILLRAGLLSVHNQVICSFLGFLKNIKVGDTPSPVVIYARAVTSLWRFFFQKKCLKPFSLVLLVADWLASHLHKTIPYSNGKGDVGKGISLHVYPSMCVQEKGFNWVLHEHREAIRRKTIPKASLTR